MAPPKKTVITEGKGRKEYEQIPEKISLVQSDWTTV